MMRNFLAGLGGGSGAFGAAAVVLLLIAAGYWVQSGRNDTAGETDQVALVSQEPVTEEAEDVPQVASTAEPEAKSEAPQTSVTEETHQAEAVQNADAAPTPAPTFDEVRREADGMTVVAGTAAPGADVRVLQNGVEVGRVIADGAGKFATLAVIPPDGKGHVLTLLQNVEGVEKRSDGEIILAPLAPVEVVVAQAETALEVKPEAGSDPVATSQEEGTADTAEAADPVPLATGQTAEETDTIGSTTEAAATSQAAVPSEASGESKAQETAVTQDPKPGVAGQQAAVDTTVARADVAQEGEATADPERASDESVESAPQTAQAPLVPDNDITASAAAEAAPAEPAAVAVLRSTQAGVELLNTPSPDVMENVAIDTISYSDVGDVQLAGRAQSATKSVRVYLDNQSVISLPVDEQGRWRGELPDVDEGIYTLRVDEVTADGNVTSRVETPFKREATEVLEAAAAGLDGPLKAITVQKGATLWAIARDRYGDGALYVRVFDANTASIRDPDLIYPGQVFDLPD